MKCDKETTLTRYTTESTSSQSSEINKVILNETSNTRRILESKIVKKAKDSEASLHITIIHEKKSGEGFEADRTQNLTKLKGGEWVSCDLDSATALALYEQLSQQYALARQVGIENYTNSYLVVKLSQAANLSTADEDSLAQLMKQCHHSPDFAKKLSQLNPDLIRKAHDYQLLQHKQDGLAKFKVMLKSENCAEPEWQDFFKEHDWILGGVHDIQYLSDVLPQPIFSGANVDGSGAKRGDFLACTPGNAHFTAIVELKKASTRLLNSTSYRSDIYPPSTELNGGIAQLRAYLRKWQINGSTSTDYADRYESKGIYTVQPQGFLIAGNLNEIKDNRQMREAFELFRNNQKDIHILTFDEVYSRAKHLVGVDSE